MPAFPTLVLPMSDPFEAQARLDAPGDGMVLVSGDLRLSATTQRP